MSFPTIHSLWLSRYSNLIRSIFALSGALGVFCLVMLASHSIWALYHRLQWRWTRALATLRQMRPHSSEPAVLREGQLYLLPPLDFQVIYLLASCLGFGLTFVLLEGERLTLRALLGLGAFLLPYLWKRERIVDLQWEYARQVQSLIIRLRMDVSLGRTLSQALEAVAMEAEDSQGESGSVESEAAQLFRRRVVYHIRTLQSLARPERVLSALARDFKSEILNSLLVKIDAAQLGGATYGEALAEAVDETMASRLANARLAIQEAPMKLLLPMLVGLFPPPIMLMMLPVVTRVLAGMGTAR